MTGFVVVIASSCVQNSWDFTRVSLVQVCLWEETLQPLWALSFARICTRPVFSQEYKDHKWICAHPAGNCDPWWGTERHTGLSAARAQNYMSLHIAPETAFSGWPSETLRGLYLTFWWLQTSSDRHNIFVYPWEVLYQFSMSPQCDF